MNRCVEVDHNCDDVVSRELHGFSDASLKGYGACSNHLFLGSHQGFITYIKIKCRSAKGIIGSET